jgi:hypothetical protein
LIFNDPFDGSYLPNLGDQWCGFGANWRIESSAAVANANLAKAICKVRHPVPDGSMVVVIKTKDEIDNSGQVYRVMLNVQKNSSDPENCTSDNFYFADYTRLSASTSKIELGICSAGVETILKSDLIVGLVDTTRNFAVTLSDKEFCASVSNAVLSFVGTTPLGLFPTGYYSGFRVSHADMKVDEFWFFEHHRTNPDCLECICACGPTVLPPVLKVSIYPVTPGCVRLNLLDDCLEFTIEWDRVNSKWVGEQICCHGRQGWRISFHCPNVIYGVGDPMTAVMSIEVGCTSSCGGCGNTGLLPIEATCTPPRFKYGPFFVSGLDLTCFCSTSNDFFGRPSCSYYVEVTV